MPLLTPSEIEARLRALPRWSRQGDAIARTFPFPDFATAMAFVNRVATLADQAWHHPDIDIRWGKVTLSITTHDEGGLTERDFSLAAAIDELQLRPEEPA
jgi:4a-hydroxytetrahydrobiopterin dehydratase